MVQFNHFNFKFIFFSFLVYISGLIHVPTSGNTVDDIINAVARGVYKSSSKRKKRSSSSSPKKLKAPSMQSYSELQNMQSTPMLLVTPLSQIPQTPTEPERNESKRGRGRRKRTDELYWYEGDGGLGETSTKQTQKATPSSTRQKQSAKLKTPSSSKKRGARPTAKLKFTHNYDALPPPPQAAVVSPVKMHHVSKTSVHAAPSFEDPDRLYCYCRCPYDEVSQMIGCDASDCPYEWFHFECVGISEAPEGTYYCPECRLRPKYRAMFDEPFFHPQPPPQQII